MPKYRKKPLVIEAQRMDKAFSVETLEGVMTGNPGDYLITGVKGEQYPCAADVFEASYDPVDGSTSRWKHYAQILAASIRGLRKSPADDSQVLLTTNKDGDDNDV